MVRARAVAGVTSDAGVKRQSCVRSAGDRHRCAPSVPLSSRLFLDVAIMVT